MQNISFNLNLENNYHTSLNGLYNPFNLLVIKDISRVKSVLYICSNEQSALKHQKDLKTLFDTDSTIFPASEIGFYTELEKNYYIYQEQINALINKPKIILTYPKALLERFPDESFYKENKIEFKINDTIDYNDIAKNLVNLGYKRTAQVTDIGEFALRGDILDIYHLDSMPVRIEFFADLIEDIREFDPISQKSINHIEKTTIYPLFKFVLDDKNKKNFINNIKKKKDKNQSIKNELIEKIDKIGYFEGIEYYLNDICKSSSVLEYFKNYVIVFDETYQILSKYENIDEQYTNDYKEGLLSDLKLSLDELNHTTMQEFENELKSFTKIGFDSFMYENANKTIEFDMSLVPLFSSNIEEVKKFIKKYDENNYKINICTNFEERLKEIINIQSKNLSYFPDISTMGSIWDEKKVIYITDKEIFNKKTRDITTKKYSYNKQTQNYIDTIDDIKPDEYVVHSIHGIGIYKGISKETIDDTQKDYLEIQFQGKDKLFMPAEQINLLCRYRGSNIKPPLSKMGGSSWENTKRKTKDELSLIAYDLLDLYAKRKLSKGIQFEPDSTWQFEMEENFEYIETPDQMKAINDTKHDMEEDKPMDRLICADVGFGKTEVAARAMFKAVMSGYQTAMIAPTTILTMQHYETIKERFEPYDIKVDILNRFSTKKEQNEIIEKINAGKTDVVIGTHRLLSDDVKFKKLGLLVIDEEHKFGVRQKERLKKFKENIDILALSATPIPRTLNMALSGIKDMSVINTPPKNRLPIKTYVSQYDPKLIKNAINQEIMRDGQVYYLYNRVETIENFKKTLQDIVPNARIKVAHGKMNEKELEDTMCSFERKEFDVLLCTTIIESGLDIANVNTIIIHNAQNFGLAQLYQLRGRVGRSERQAYCFCLYKKTQILNEQAQQRLESIKSFTSLGSGYKIALRDIEIRGVGNLLGTKQHGMMTSVGFDTYCELLNQCVEDIKRAQNNQPPIEKQENAVVDIHADAYIPDEWAQTYEQKILEYKRLSDAKTLNELEEMKVNFKDRFANIPNCVENLIKLIKIRIIATNIKIISIRQINDTIRIEIPYCLAEWNLIKAKSENKITKDFRFTPPNKNSKKTKGILLLENTENDFDKTFNKLIDLFYYISKVVTEFKAN